MSLIAKLRTIFTLGQGVLRGITELRAGEDPIVLFREWFEAAKRGGLFLPEAMTLATSTSDGKPSARMVLLKEIDSKGFVFFTNYESRKSKEITDNPNGALVFHWGILERQVRVEGKVEKISQEQSDAYFRTRPRGSQIGAWASSQSSPLDSPTTLAERFDEYEKKFQGQEVPLPDFWGGYRLIPERIEFWQGRLNRLHDRLVYERGEGTWSISRVYP
ncbi:MAG: pyridoxamine 5'-phosphate oxidase [Gemmatimonadota bacterium]|nr:pyridoxamine 5'-phosphate oxidase [Gemmatimonadota bacterium]MDH5805105.1 pyridoxamine 5'-phosphate oxidase [Gemmatimonadota bacterium]